MSVNPSPIGGYAAQFFDNNGVILSGGKIYTYAAGTTTPQATYTSASGVTPHANPIVLDSAGRVPGGEIWLTDGLVYKFVIETSTAILIGSYDNITGVNSNFVNYTVQEEVITATAGQTVFNLSTINYTPGTNSLSVYIDGVNQYVGESYLETDSNTVTFTSGVHVGGEVKFTTAIQTTTGAVNADIVAYDPPFTGGVTTTVQDKLAQYISVKDFGAVGDGVADDTAAIQAALNTGGFVYLPKGTYRTTATLDVTIDGTGLYGDGISSLIQPDFQAGDIFQIGDGTNIIWGLTFSNFQIWPSVQKTSGYAFNNRIAKNSRWENVYLGFLQSYISHRLYDGYYFDRFGECAILGGQIIVEETAVKTRGNADQSNGFELTIDNNARILFAQKGIWVGGASGGIYLNRMDASNCVNGLYVDDTLQTGVINREIFLSPGCTIDGSGEWGIVFKTNSVALFQATGLWIASSGQTSATSGGVLVEAGNTGNFSWTGTICYNNAYDGFSISSGTHNITGGFIRNNGSGASGGHGVALLNIDNATISSATIHNNGSASRGYGIYTTVGVNDFTIQTNQFFSNGQGPVFAPNTDLTSIYRDNFGYVTENSGFATLPSGSATVDVLHGLSDVPTNVLLSFAGAQDANAYVYTAPSSWTTTKFTVTYSTTATANRDFSWRATRGQA